MPSNNLRLNEKLETSGPVDSATFNDLKHLLSLAEKQHPGNVTVILNLCEKFVMISQDETRFPKLEDFPQRAELVSMLSSVIPLMAYLATSFDINVCTVFFESYRF